MTPHNSMQTFLSRGCRPFPPPSIGQGKTNGTTLSSLTTNHCQFPKKEDTLNWTTVIPLLMCNLPPYIHSSTFITYCTELSKRSFTTPAQKNNNLILQPAQNISMDDFKIKIKILDIRQQGPAWLTSAYFSSLITYFLGMSSPKIGQDF